MSEKREKKQKSQAVSSLIWELSYMNDSSKMWKEVQTAEATLRGLGGNRFASNDLECNYCDL